MALLKATEVEAVKSLTESEKRYIATWMAKAFDRHDPFPAVFVGKVYADDPLSHYLLFRAIIDRVCEGAEFTVSKDRNAFAVRFPPGVEDKFQDFDWRSGRDQHWDRLLARCGGMEAVKRRAEPCTTAVIEHADKIYGKDGALKHIRGNWLGVNPEVQQRGYARAIHEFNMREAERRGCLVLFGSVAANLPIYLRIGGRAVGPPFIMPNDIAARYGKQWQVCQLMESGTYVDKDKQADARAKTKSKSKL